MDYQKIIDSYRGMACILSVEKLPDGSAGRIRIAYANKAYIDSIEDPGHVSSSEMLDNTFVPNSDYTRYIPKDLNFEHIVYLAAIEGHPQHSYVNLERYSFWINAFLMPLQSDDPNMGYCTYSMEITMQADSKMMSQVSANASSDVLQTCIKLRGTGDPKTIFNEVVADIREICDSDHCCILLTDKATRSCRILGEAIKDRSGRLSMQEYLDDNFFAITETWKGTIAGSSCFIAQNESDMQELRKRNPLWGESLRGAGVKTIVLFPLQYGGETYGYIWALDFNIENTTRIRETLELATFFIASEISNLRLMDKLKTMSSVDLLTGVFNRNAMNNRVDNIISGERNKKPTGVIFTDINGLKYVNDNKGHNEGDKLIKTAADVLKDICRDCEIYRAGGDEFMILVLDTARDDFNSLLNELRQFSDNSQGVSFAVGGYFDDGEIDIRKAMRIADEQMYIDKVRCYQRFPKLKR